MPFCSSSSLLLAILALFLCSLTTIAEEQYHEFVVNNTSLCALDPTVANLL
jgi:hypothetical protein